MKLNFIRIFEIQPVANLSFFSLAAGHPFAVFQFLKLLSPLKQYERSIDSFFHKVDNIATSERLCVMSKLFEICLTKLVRGVLHTILQYGQPADIKYVTLFSNPGVKSESCMRI